MPRISLLTFSLNDTLNIKNNLAPYFHYFDEIVIIDSSSPQNYETLKAYLTEFQNVKLYHVLPLGYADPLRMYALSKCTGEYVLYLDADEEPSDTLLDHLKSMILDSDSDGFYIIRYELGEMRNFDKSHVYSLQLRLIKPNAVYTGMIHEVARVKNKVSKLDNKFYLKHYGKRDSENYPEIEAILNPFTFGKYLKYLDKKGLHFRGFSSKMIQKINKMELPLMLSILFSSFFSILYYIKKLPQKGLIKYLYFDLLYNLNVIKHYYKKSRKERRFLIHISQEIEANGGLIKFLGLDNQDYVEKISDTFDWKIPGIYTLKFLINYKIKNGYRANRID